MDEGDAPALSAGASCDALLAALQNELLEQVSARAEQAKISADVYYGGGVFIDDVAPPSFSGPVLAAAPGVPPVLSVAPSGGFAPPTAQVPGVDEADFVKADGDRLYQLYGSTLFVLDTEPANATQLIGSIPIEGDGAELFVRDGQVVVFSRIYGPIAGTEDTYSPYIYYYPSFTKLTVIDTTGEAPEVLREAYVEGDYGYGRRQDGVVRGVVLQSTKAQLDYPSVSYVDIFGNPRSQEEIDVQVDLWALLATESIEDSTIENYLPTSFERVDGDIVAQPLNCADFYLPQGITVSGSTSVFSLDLDAVDAPLESVSILGYSDGVYVDAESLILRQTNYGDYTQPIATPQTNIHRFELDGTSASYTASGSVTGYVQGQFGLDQADGAIRVAVAQDLYQEVGEGAYEYLGSASRVLTLGQAGAQLVELGSTPNFALNESLTATRFVGDRGYVAAYAAAPTRLYVIDLSDPAAPAIIGSVDTPAFYANQLLPLAGEQLLGFGQAIDALGYSTVSLQLFDVADASAPSVTHQFVFSEQSKYSDAAYDPRAITFDATQETLAFPVLDGLTGLSSLEVFELSSESGFTQLGSVTPPAVELSLEDCLLYLGYGNDPAFLEQVEADPAFRESLLAQCRSYNQAYVRRGLFRGDDLFAISSLNVAAYALDALDEPLSVVDLPQSYYSPVPIPIDLAPAPAPTE